MPVKKKSAFRRSTHGSCDPGTVTLGACCACRDPRPAITVDLPEGDVCAICVQGLVKKLRTENSRLKRKIAAQEEP
jgi:hypothetical protein